MSFNYYRTIRFKDTDAAGVVYFANILAICHEAYEESLEASGIDLQTFFAYSPLALPIVHSSIDFNCPLFCGNKLLVILRTQQLGIDKFEVNYEILMANVIASKAITRHVCIEISTRQKHQLPNQIRHWLYNNHGDEYNREKNQ